MKITINTSASAPGMAEFGPTALMKDQQKTSMHPALPEHIEYVEHDMKLHEQQETHHIVQRRHPENDVGTFRTMSVNECCYTKKSKFGRCPHCGK